MVSEYLILVYCYTLTQCCWISQLIVLQFILTSCKNLFETVVYDTVNVSVFIAFYCSKTQREKSDPGESLLTRLCCMLLQCSSCNMVLHLCCGFKWEFGKSCRKIRKEKTMDLLCQTNTVCCDAAHMLVCPGASVASILFQYELNTWMHEGTLCVCVSIFVPFEVHIH